MLKCHFNFSSQDDEKKDLMDFLTTAIIIIQGIIEVCFYFTKQFALGYIYLLQCLLKFYHCDKL